MTNVTINTLIAISKNIFGSDLKRVVVEPNLNVTLELKESPPRLFTSPEQAHKKLVNAFYASQDQQNKLRFKGENW